MSLETLILILVGTVVVTSVGTNVVLAIALCKSNRQLMWFHRSGNSMAQYELEKARISLDEEKTKVEASRAATEHIRARREAESAMTPTGGKAKRLT